MWERVWRSALAALDQQGKLDWSMAFLDGSFAPAKNGGEKVGLTRKGKGTKWMLVVDGNGLPLGFHLDSANRAEVTLAEQTLDAFRVARPRGRPKRRPEKLVADRGYDSQAFRAASSRHRHVYSTQAASQELEGQAGTPSGGAQGGVSAAVYGGTQLCLVGQLPAAADPLGAPVQRLPERIRFRRHAALCAPSDCPRMPDPVGVRGGSRARAVYEARSIQPSWSTTGLGPHQPTRGQTASSAPQR